MARIGWHEELPVPYKSLMNNSTRDYGRIEKAIRFLDDNVRRQPGLTEVARHVGMSDFHFQRLFSRWAGVSPKKFLQFLTARYARSLLQDSRSVLDVAYDVGLSGGARLHDLTINLYGMTPGEVKAKGAALIVRYGVHSSPFGPCFIATTSRGICALRFIESGTVGQHLDELGQAWAGSRFVRDQRKTASVMQRLFAHGGRKASEQRLAVLVRGTPFQIKVWEALLHVPAGHVISYQGLAQRIGRATAARAVGSAVAQNSVAYLIPCHRVIHSTGAFGNYRWDPVRKKALVGWEAAQREGA